MVMERQRERERAIDPHYDTLVAHLRDKHVRSLEGKIVVHGDEEPWGQSRQAYVQYLLHPFKTETAYPHMQVFINEIATHGGSHRHQGGLVIYVLDGRGHTVYDGKPSYWEAGDLMLLPIKPGGVEHQHFNEDPRRPARWLAFITNTFREYLASELVQVKSSPDWKGSPSSELAPSISDQRIRDGLPASAHQGPWNDGTYLDSLFQLRDDYRHRAETGESHIHSRDLQWEINRQGKMLWYMHPRKEDTSLRSLVFWRHEIPGGSRSGRQLHPGGIVHYVLRGRGHTMLDGERHDWKAGDLVALPIRAHGIDYQHFNDDPRESVEFVAAMPNLLEILGPDLGGRLEQLEEAPEYAARPRG